MSERQSRPEYYGRPHSIEREKGCLKKVGKGVGLPVGRKQYPTQEHRNRLAQASDFAEEGRLMANLAVHGRVGFEHKYPQAYEGHKALADHHEQIGYHQRSAVLFAEDKKAIAANVSKFNQEIDYQVLDVPRPVFKISREVTKAQEALNHNTPKLNVSTPLCVSTPFFGAKASGMCCIPHWRLD